MVDDFASSPTGLCNEVVTPMCKVDVALSRVSLHQAAIDAMKPERDREAAKSMAALAKEWVAVG